MTEAPAFSVYQKRFVPNDPRLGRHVLHDSRSLNYQIEAGDISQLKSVRHQRHIPILDQGRIGSCEGNAGIGVLGTGLFWTPQIQKILSMAANEVENYAVSVYSEATIWDPFPGSYPPTDTGTNNLTMAKTIKKRGLISGYLHALSFEAFLTALARKPLLAGTLWRTAQFKPESDGRVRITGSDEGGHAYVFDELDVENKRVWFSNSWTEGWGVKGRAYYTWDDAEVLLAADGEITEFIPVTEPEPQPIPPAPPAPNDPKADLLKAVKDLDVALHKFMSA